MTKEKLLELLAKEKTEFKFKALRFMCSGLVLSLGFVGFFLGVNSVIKLSPLVFLFPSILVLAFLILIIKVIIFM